MNVDRVIKDARRTMERILEALDHNLTARENMAPEGAAGQVLTSNGAGSPPTFSSELVDRVAALEQRVTELEGS